MHASRDKSRCNRPECKEKHLAFRVDPWYNGSVTTLQTTRKAGLGAKLARALALLLAFSCLWMGTVVALDHTEDFGLLQASRTFYHGPTAETHAALLTDPGPCLACQWEGIAANSQTPGVTVPSPPPAVLPLDETLPAPPLSAALRHTRSRAPPCALA